MRNEMTQPLKIVVPMAGFGSRLRPHTWSKPKQLISMAGKAALAHVLDMFNTLPDPENAEYIFIIGYLGEQIKAYMQEYHPHLNVRYVVQKEMKGQSHAIYQARELLDGPMLMVWADTLVETDLSFLAEETAGGVAWVYPVEDPRRFGVAQVDADNRVTRLIEKPKTTENKLTVVGFYYFADSLALLSAIEEQFRRGVQLKGEYFLADAVNIMLERGLRMRAEQVPVWLDAGTPAATLDTNRYLLDHGHESQLPAELPGVSILPPVSIHPSADVQGAVIGPHVSIGANCIIRRSVIRNSIIEPGAEISDVLLDGSMVGRNAKIQGRESIINAGDNAVIAV